MPPRRPRALVAGHFSTIGDVACLDFVRDILVELDLPFDVTAFVPEATASLENAVRVADLDPTRYTHLLVVCGPIWPGMLEKAGMAFADYAHCCRIGINLTMVEPVDRWNPFDYLLERDSNRHSDIDLALLQEDVVPKVIAVCLIEAQPLYGDRQLHGKTCQVVEDCLSREGYAVLRVDTRWPVDRNRYGIGNAGQFSALLRAAHLLITNRLHGLVYGTKVGIPVVAIDSVRGGDKVTKQAELLGSASLVSADALSVDGLASLIRGMLAAPQDSEKLVRVAELQESRRTTATGDLRSALIESRRREDAERSLTFDAIPPAREVVRGGRLISRARTGLKALLRGVAERL